LLDYSVFLVWMLCGLVMVGFTIAVTLNDRIRWNDASFGALVALVVATVLVGIRW